MKNYNLVIDVMADKIKSNEATIEFLKWQIADLEKKLAEAEYHLNPTPEKAKKLEIRKVDLKGAKR